MAIDFDGTDDDIDLGDPTSLQLTGAMTISCWLLSDISQASKRPVSKRGGAGARGYTLQTSSGSPVSKISFMISTDGTATINSGDSALLSAGVWHYVVGIFEPSTSVRVLLDLVKTENTTSIPATQFNPTTNVRIGATGLGGSGFFNGKMNDVRIYNRVLSDDELQTIFAARGVDGIVNGLVGRWLLNEKSPGTTVSGAGSVKDIGPFGNNGTPVSAPVYIEGELRFRRKIA